MPQRGTGSGYEMGQEFRRGLKQEERTYCQGITLGTRIAVLTGIGS